MSGITLPVGGNSAFYATEPVITTGNQNAKAEPGRERTPPVDAGATKGKGNGISQGGVEKMSTLIAPEDLDYLSNELDDGVELPRPQKTNVNRKTIYSVLNSLQALMLEQSGNYLENVKHMLATFAANHDAYTKELKEKLDAFAGDLEKAMGELEDATSMLEGMGKESQHLKSKIENLQAQLQVLRDSGMTDEDPEIQALLSEISASEDKLLQLAVPLQKAREKYERLLGVVTGISDKINSEIKNALGNEKMRAFTDITDIEQRAEKHVSSMQRLLGILTANMEFRAREVRERAETELKRAEENTRMSAETRIEQAKKAEEQAEKANEAAKKSNCISKIISFVVAAVSVALTVATGGLASPVSAILIGLTIADMASQAATGTSFIGKALEPVMKHVLGPLMNAIGKVVGFLMEKSGLKDLMPAETFDMLKSIVSAVVTVAAVIAMSMVVKNGSALMGKMNFAKGITEAVSRQATALISNISKNLPKVMKNMGKSLKNVSNKLTVEPGKAQSIAAAGKTGAEVVAAGNVAINSGFQINSQIMEGKNVEMRLAMDDFNELKRLQQKLSDEAQALAALMNEDLLRMTKRINAVINSNLQTGMFILGAAHHNKTA